MGTSRNYGPLLWPALCVLFVLATKVNADDKCTAGCSGSSAPSPAFVDGTTYTYNFDSVVSVFLTGADKKETNVKLTGTATVTALGNCAHILRVQNIAVSGPDGKRYGKPVGIEKTVRFTLQDGQIGASICTEAEDNQRSINIKRAIISLLQNANKHNAEVDIFGVCPTDISVSDESDGVVTILKSRNLNQCAHREQGKHDLLTSIYNPKAQIRSSHLLQSTLTVESKLKVGVIERAIATEEYLYRPFSIGQNGARARVITKLTLTGQAKGNEAAKPNVPKSIIFENPQPVPTEHSNVANVLLSLKTAAQALESKAGEKSASVFAGLVKILRVTNKADLLNVYGQIKSGGAVKDNDLARRVFLDALLRTGTGDSIEASIKLLKDKELSPIEQRIVFLSLTNVRHASTESLKSVAALLDQPNLPREVYLGAGALAGAYCREHQCHGAQSQSEGVAILSQKLASKLQNCKPKTKKDEDVVIAVLKGIRNIRHIEDSLVDKLSHCVSDAGVKSRVKVAALEAFNADPCTSKLKTVALNALKNRQLDSEVRIKAYLAVLDCPCAKVANEVKALLDTEPVIQVGRFIVSSLRAIRASTNPDRQAAKDHLGQIHLTNRFSVDNRRFSSFHEFSYNVDSLGAGATYEHSVIFSQNSFLPRSTDLNLTTEVFGHRVNFLEVGVRQGNLERILEHYLGPKGHIRSTDPQTLYEEALQQIYAVVDKFKERLNSQRTKRNVKQEVLAFTKQIKNELEGFSGNVELDIFVKIFGTDAIFLSLGDQELSLTGLIDKIFDQIDSGLDKAKQFTHEFRNHLLFLDAELAYPTSSGVPLKLNVQGASAIKLGFGGNVDIRRIIQDPHNAKIDVEIVPSANIEISSYIYADADLVSSGLKVISTLHTSTGSQLVVKVLDNGKGIDIQLGLPVDKQELLSATHEIVFTTSGKGQQESDVPLKFDVDRKELQGCFDQLAPALGLTFCGDVSIPVVNTKSNSGQSLQKLAASFPFSGPAKISVRLEKEDLKGYHFKGLLNDKDPSQKSVELIFEAEGSKNNRRTSLLAEVTNRDTEKGVKIEVKSPLKNVGAQAVLLNTDKEKSASLKLQNDNDEYFGKLGVAQSSGGGDKIVYTPLIEYKNPKQQNKAFNIEGNIVVENISGGKKYTFNGVRFVNSNEKTQIDGFITQEPKGFSTDLKVIQGKHNANLNGKINLIENGVKLNVEFHNSLNPNVGFLITYEGVREDGHVQNDLVFVHGSDTKSASKKLTVSQNLKYHHKSSSDFDIITKNKISYPAVNLNLEVDGEFNPKKIDLEVEAKYDKSHAEFEIEGRGDTKKKGDYSVKFEAKVNENEVEFVSKRDIIDDHKSNFQNHLQIKPGGRYELNGVVSHKIKPNDLNVAVVGHLKIAGREDSYNFDVGTVSNPTVYNSHAKISVGTVEYLDVNAKLNKGATPNGSLKVLVKGIVNAQGQFKGNKADGKGNAVIVIELIRVQRKVKLESNFLCHENQYNSNIDVFLDFEKDNSNKIQVNTNTKAQDVRNFDSKNSLTVGDKKTDVHLKSEHSGTFYDGKLLLLSEVVLSSGRVLTFKFDRNVQGKDKEHVNGNIEILVSDAKQKGAATSKLQLQGKLVDLNTKERTFTHDAQISLALTSGKNIDIAAHTQHLAKGERKTLEYKVDVTGNILPKSASLLLSSDYSREQENEKDGKFRLKVTYGSETGFDGNGKLVLKKLPDGRRSYDSDAQLHLILPFEKAHDIKLKIAESLVVPKNYDGVLEGKSAGSLQVNADEYKYDLQGKASRELGEISWTAAVPHHEPVTLLSRFKSHVQGDLFQRSSLLKVTYGKNKQLIIEVDGNRKANHEYNTKVNIKLPENEKVNDLALQLHHEHGTEETRKTNIVITVDGKAYKIDNVLAGKKTEPSFELKFTRPDNTVSRIYTKANIISDRHYTSEVKFENVRGFDLESSVDVNVISQDDIIFKADIDSEKLKLKKVHVEANTKPEGSGKKIIFTATSEGKNVVSGSTTYLRKQEGSKTIVEGSGNVKVRDEERSASFKYIREAINEPLEQGVEVLLKTEIGQKSFLVEHKATNIEYKINNVYCEEKQQCAIAELTAKLNKPGPDQLQHSLQVLIDLRKLGISPEFGLQSNADLHRNRPPVLTFDIYLNQDKSKYHLHAYSQPSKGSYPAAISLTLPQRVISLEQSLSYTEGKGLPIKGEIAFYLNKKSEPNQKAAIRFDADLQRVEHKSVTAIGDIVLSHPAIGKDLQITTKSVYDVQTHSINSNLILDIFKKKSQRVTISGKVNTNYVDRQSVNVTTELDISGKGLGIELAVLQHLAVSREEIGAGINAVLTQDKQRREAGALLHASTQDVRLQVKVPGSVLVNVDGKFDINPDSPVADLTVTLLQEKPVFLHAEAKRLESFEISSGYKNAPENKISLSGRHKLYERIEIRAEIVKGSQKQDLAHAAVFLQDNVPTTDFGISNDNIKAYVEHVKSDVKGFLERGKQVSNQLTSQAQKDVQKTGQILKNAVPDFKHVGEYYKSELEKLKTEVVNDKTLQEINALVKQFLQTLAKFINDFAAAFTSIVEQTTKALTETYEKVLTVLNEKVIPQLKALADSLVGTATELGNAIIDLVAHYVILVTDFIDKHKGEFKELTTAINDLTRDVTKLLGKRIAEIRKELSALSEKIKEQIQSLPIVQMLKEKWEEFTVPEQLVTILTEATNALKAILPNEDLKNLVDVIYNYVTKKIKREQVNDAEELQGIYQKLVQAIKSLVEQLRGHVGDYNLSSLLGLNIIPTGIPRVPVIPSGGSLSFSFLNYFRGESDSFRDYLKSYQALARPGVGLLPPFKGYAYISDGGHIFTFDGKHLTFPGTCKYILTHDSVDGNFSIAANLNNGVLKSIVLVDKVGNVVEVKDNGQLFLNNANHGYPVDSKDIAAWKNQAGISILSNYGAKIRCLSNLKLCQVRVSGFYFGRTRGLLGDLNNEPYDDFKIPSGKVATTESEFGNAYRVIASCPAAKAVEHTPDHDHTPSPVCDDVLNSEVSFKACRYTINIDNYRTACHHATLAHPDRAEEEACKIALAYATACQSAGLRDLIRVPTKCAVCKDGKDTYHIGDHFEVKLPQKQADIIVAVKLTKDNEQSYKDLVVPVVSQLVDELKSKKIDDIKVKLVGISTKIPHAIWYDTENNKLKGAKIKFQEPDKLEPITLPVTKNERIDNFIRKLADALQPARGVISFANARGGISGIFDIPLRPHAVKTVLLFPGDVCPKMELYKVPFNFEIISKLYARGISLNTFTTLEDIEIPGVDTKELVGVNNKNAILLSGEKSIETDRSPISVKTVCDSLTKFSRGNNLFSVNSFNGLGAPQRKQYLQQATHSIVNLLVNKELETQCNCNLENGVIPNIDCHINSLEGLRGRGK